MAWVQLENALLLLQPDSELNLNSYNLDFVGISAIIDNNSISMKATLFKSKRITTTFKAMFVALTPTELKLCGLSSESGRKSKSAFSTEIHSIVLCFLINISAE